MVGEHRVLSAEDTDLLILGETEVGDDEVVGELVEVEARVSNREPLPGTVAFRVRQGGDVWMRDELPSETHSVDVVLHDGTNPDKGLGRMGEDRHDLGTLRPLEFSGVM